MDRIAKSPIRARRCFFEALESRTLLSSTVLATLTLPGGNLNNYADPRGNFDASVVAADLEGNGQDDAIVVCGDYNVRAYAYNSSTSSFNLIATYVTTTFTDANGNSIAAAIHNTPVVVDMPGIGQTVWFGNDNGYVFGFNALTGASLVTPYRVEPPSGSFPAGSYNIYGSLTAADLMGTGTPDIIVNSFHHETTALQYNSNGTLSQLWQITNDDTIESSPAVGDINGDLQIDVVTGGDSSATPYTGLGGATDYYYWSGGRIDVYSPTGRRVMMYQTDQTVMSSPALADLTGDGKLNIISGTGYYYPQPDAPPYPGNEVYAINPDGTTLWTYQTEPSNIDGRVFASPAIGDLNGDGKLDVVVVDGSGVVHAISNTGTGLWNFQLPDAQSQGADYSSPIIADWTGNGQQDVILNEGPFLYVLDGKTGSVIYSQTFNNQLFYNSPAVGNFTGDGSWQMVMVSAGSNSTLSVHLSPTTMTILEVRQSTNDPPDWGQFRDTANHYAVERDPTFDQNLITTAFEAFYNRPPTTAELQAYLPVFSTSPSLTYALGSIVGSDAARIAQIDSWYSTYLGRAPAPSEVATWLDQNHLGGGMTYSTAQAIFIASPEFFANSGGTVTAWVTAIYQTVLGRAPDAGGLQSWMTRLGANTFDNRVSNVVEPILLSPEKTNDRIITFYATVQPFGMTAPDAATLAAAGWVLRSGAREEYVYVEILGSLGYFEQYFSISAVIQGYYQDLLGREPTDAELGTWIQQTEARVDSGMSLAAALNVITSALIVTTAARTQNIDVFYQQILGRNATTAEVTAEIAALNAGGTYKQLVQTLLSSDEFFNTIAGGNMTTYITDVYERAMGRDPLSSDISTWLSLSTKQNIRITLPAAVVQDAGFYDTFINKLYVQLLRRYPNTPSDQSRLIASATPYAAQNYVNAWAAGADYEAIELSILSSQEYYNLMSYKADWLGSRWLS